MRFLQQVCDASTVARPLIRVRGADRTDADTHRGPLWQEVSRSSLGLPYHTIQGLTRSDARRVLDDCIEQLQPERNWHVEELLDTVVRESLPLDASGDVFPPYLQMVLSQISTSPTPTVAGAANSANELATPASTGDLIGRYMENQLAHLESREGHFRKCRDVIVALSRSNGQKLTLTLGEIAAELRLSCDALQPVLNALTDSRLVRPVGESYEIQHDRLAALVIDSLSNTDRELKAVRELLMAKTVSHGHTKEWLTEKECLQLYRHHENIAPSKSELRLLLGTFLLNVFNDERARPGWLFISRLSAPMPILQELANCSDEKVRFYASASILQHSEPAFVDAVRAMDSQQIDWGTIQSAAKAIMWTRDADALALAREFAHSDSKSLKCCGIAIFLHLESQEDLPLLRELARHDDTDVAFCALVSLSRIGAHEDLAVLRESACSTVADIRYAAAEGLKRFRLPDDLPLLAELARDEDAGVRLAAAAGIARVASGKVNHLLEELSEDEDAGVREAAAMAIWNINQLGGLPLVDRAKHEDWSIRWDACREIEKLNKPEDLWLLREIAGGCLDDQMLRDAVVTAISGFQLKDDLPLLRELLRDTSPAACSSAIDVVSIHRDPMDLPLLRELAAHSSAE
ncbi:MAG: HEAT repeat domain-containing protein, partial [Planctomycetota bacterium]